MESAAARKSYWARNFVGWPRWSTFQPNDSHKVLYQWERSGLLRCVITQNVDQLHYKSGLSRVIELHGTTAIVKCMSCSFSAHRYTLQKLFQDLNPDFTSIGLGNEIRPDGDVELPQVIFRLIA